MIAGILVVTALAALMFTALYVWCLGVVAEIPDPDPIGDLITAWWLAVAWLSAWTGGNTTALPPCAECGCPHEVHTHFRDGSDCGPCGPDVCPGYRCRPRLFTRARWG